MPHPYLPILVFLTAGIIMILIPLFLAWLIGPRRKEKEERNSIYECGKDPIGKNRFQFKVHYYLVALVFIIFEVEIIYLVPWTIVLQKLGLSALITMFIFLSILILGLIYALSRKVLEWD